jgi:hypothetical protein
MQARHFLFFILAALALSLTGCAAGFRAGGPEAGLSAGARVGPDAAAYHPQPPAP